MRLCQVSDCPEKALGFRHYAAIEWDPGFLVVDLCYKHHRAMRDWSKRGDEPCAS